VSVAQFKGNHYRGESFGEPYQMENIPDVILEGVGTSESLGQLTMIRSLSNILNQM
jgi:hypothetical protein